MRVNLHLLRIFLAVAEQQSFSRAAETLFISQPAVSRAVRELERQLGLELLERDPGGMRGLRTTDAGQALIEHARGIFALERAAVEDVRARVELKRGRLTIGASTAIAGYRLSPYLTHFMARSPAIELEIQAGNTRTVVGALMECRTDLALVEDRVDDSRLVAAHWRDETVRVITHSCAPLALNPQPTLAELSRQIWLVREPGSGTRGFAERVLAASGIRPQRQIVFGSNEGIARAVASGLGVAMLPSCIVEEVIPAGAVAEVRLPAGAPPPRALYLLQLKARTASPLVRAFIETLRRPLDWHSATAKIRVTPAPATGVPDADRPRARLMG
jgi:LysR family transcriptional regulator, transcriptional activator of the cysJI operon